MKNEHPRETASGLSNEKPAGLQKVSKQKMVQENQMKSKTQDDYNIRAKSSRHGKVTADHWNQ